MSVELNNLSVMEWKMYEFCRERCKAEYEESTGKSLAEIADGIIAECERFITDKDSLKKYILETVTAYCDPVNPILNPDLEKKRWWTDFMEKNPSKLQYWGRFHSWINKKPNWNPIDIAHIDQSTNKLMNVLAEPGSGACDRHGLIYGLVQSGKTAHYISTVNKALDAGYKYIIILTGIQNSLRSQTQQRFDKEVLGYFQTQEDVIPAGEISGNIIGVGLE